MKNELLLEIKRTHELMGIKSNLILLETTMAVWPPTWLIKLAIGSTKNFNDIIRSVRKVGTLTDENIDDICRKLEDAGATKSQIDELKKLFKENKEINDLLKNSDDFYGALAKARNINISDDASKILDNVAKTTTALTERQIKDIVNQTLKNLPKESQDAVDTLIKNIENAAEKKLNQITDNGLTLNNKEEVYDYMLMLLNKSLKKNVDNKTIPAQRASIYFDNWSQRLKDSQKIKNKLDGIPTSANPKTTVTPKYGEKFIEPDFYVKNADGTPVKTTVKGSPITRTKTSTLVGDDGNPIVTTERLSDDIANKYEQLKGKTNPTKAETEFLESVEEWKSGTGKSTDVETNFQNIGDDVIDEVPTDVIDDIDLEDIEIIGDVGGINKRWTDIFFRKEFQKRFGVLIDMLRGMGRNPEEFAIKARQTLDELNNKVKEIDALTGGNINPDQLNFSPEIKELFTEIQRLSFRLKSDLTLAQSPNRMFQSQWNEIEKIINNSIRNYEQKRRFLDYIDGPTNQAKIKNFLEYATEEGQNLSFQQALKDYFSGDESWTVIFTKTSLKDSPNIEYFLAARKAIDEAKGFLPKLKVFVFRLAKFILYKGFRSAVFGVTSSMKSISKMFRGNSLFTGLQGLKKIGVTVATLSVLANVFKPLGNLMFNLLYAGTDMILNPFNMDLPGEGTPIKTFQKECSELVRFQKYEINPIRVPGSGFLGVGEKKTYDKDGKLIKKEDYQPLGFSNAPLPEAPIEFFMDLIFKIGNKDIGEEVESAEDRLKRELDIQISEMFNTLSEERKEQLKKLANHDFYSMDISKYYDIDPLLGKKMVDHTYFYIKTKVDKTLSPQEILNNSLNDVDIPENSDIRAQTRICENTPKKDKYNLEYCPGPQSLYDTIKKDYDAKVLDLKTQYKTDIINVEKKELNKINKKFEKDLKTLEEKRYMENKKNEGKSWRLIEGDTDKNNLLDDNNWKEEILNYYELTEKQKNDPKFTLVAKPLYVKNSKFNNYEQVPMGPKNNRNVGFSGDLGTLLK